jgi:enoyl-CoA hydratase/carnithine racemase
LQERAKEVSEMPNEAVLYEKKGNIGYITLNRPKVFNAINVQLIRELKEALIEAEKDDEVRVVIVTGAGKAFQSGADIKELSEMDDWQLHKWNHDIVEDWSMAQKLKKPVIAAINGWAMGGGLELALSCDIRVASENARMGLPEVSLGIVPGTGGTQRLPRLVGKGKALEMLLTGEPIDAKEAYRICLVNKVVPEGEAVKEAEEIANKIIRNGPLAVMLAKDSVQVGEELPLDAAIEYGHKNVILAAASSDAKEGYAAFLEKRKPEWKGE